LPFWSCHTFADLWIVKFHAKQQLGSGGSGGGFNPLYQAEARSIQFVIEAEVLKFHVLSASIRDDA